MSYDIYLNDPKTGQTIEFDEPHQLMGGTRALGGTKQAWLNITYNYRPIFRRVLGENGIRTIYGMTGQESLFHLESAINRLGHDYNEDYWEATEGNAKLALNNLRTLATMRPDGIWSGD